MEIPSNVTCTRKDWEILHAIKASAYITASAESFNVNLSGVNIRGLTQPKPRQEESDWVRVEGQKFQKTPAGNSAWGSSRSAGRRFGPHHLSRSMKNSLGINGAHLRPFLFINSVKHDQPAGLPVARLREVFAVTTAENSPSSAFCSTTIIGGGHLRDSAALLVSSGFADSLANCNNDLEYGSRPASRTEQRQGWQGR